MAGRGLQRGYSGTRLKLSRREDPGSEISSIAFDFGGVPFYIFTIRSPT